VRLCVFEDAGVANLEPLSLTRPAFDLWLGTTTLLTRFQRLFPTAEVGAIVRPSLTDLCRLSHPTVAVNDLDWLQRGPVLFVNARWLPLAVPVTYPEIGEIGLCGEQIAYAHMRSAELDEASPDRLAERLLERRSRSKPLPASGAMLNYLWQLVERNAEALVQDAFFWRSEKKTATVDHCSVVGPRDQVFVDAEATVEPQVLLDTTRGPVLIDREASVQAFSRLEGPCYVGRGSQILAAKLRGGSIGPQCRIGGEVETSIVLGYANKYHDGFLGHSYVGEWVNFGAGSHTSDLRTDYAPISMPVNGSNVPTGQLKIGSYLGDHTRMSVNTLLNTGTVVGPFGLLLTSGTLLPRLIPAFCRYGHGRVQERTDLGQMFATAATVMARRGQEWTETHAEFYFRLYEDTTAQRLKVLRDNEQHWLRRVV
jgi:UDP-N-acetylglucosamine diphosphorylase / glucose-1-phosphate thymidylyltransferase / UDP-N-acetylgalactosamine diphosphorylase / glucosamine-1-phosphate N-acetyltransferase / galactosamine-1-phosphate N-acetyltransferase